MDKVLLGVVIVQLGIYGFAFCGIAYGVHRIADNVSLISVIMKLEMAIKDINRTLQQIRDKE